MDEVIDLLKRTELFAELPEQKIGEIVSIGRIEAFDSGETVISEGDPSDELYVIQGGMVEVSVPKIPVPDVPGTSDLTPVVQLGQGQVFGEMALVDQGARSATVRAVTKGTRLFVVPREGFWELCDSDHYIGYVVMRNIARDLSFKLRHRNLQTVS